MIEFGIGHGAAVRNRAVGPDVAVRDHGVLANHRRTADGGVDDSRSLTDLHPTLDRR